MKDSVHNFMKVGTIHNVCILSPGDVSQNVSLKNY